MRWPGNVRIKHKETTIFNCKCGDERHEFGVGFMINDRLLHNINKFEAINERFIHLKISGQNKIIINCHTPTEDKDGETKDAFYEELKRTYDLNNI
jgi:hypothetical protein